MATLVSEQEYEPILAWTQLLATLQNGKDGNNVCDKIIFSSTKLVLSRLLDIGLILFGVFIDLKCISDHEHGKKGLGLMSGRP